MGRSMTDRPAAVASARSVTFRATIPPIETAIKVHGEGGARLILDIAESDLGGFLPAVVMRGKVLTVTLQG
jgi:hypothetical protein